MYEEYIISVFYDSYYTLFKNNKKLKILFFWDVVMNF